MVENTGCCLRENMWMTPNVMFKWMGLQTGSCPRSCRVTEENLQIPEGKTRKVLGQWRKSKWVIGQTDRKKKLRHKKSSVLYNWKLAFFTHPPQQKGIFKLFNLTKSTLTVKKYLRHRNDHEIQPVPWVSKECKIVYTESSCGDFNKWLKSINSCERVPERQKQWQNQFTRRDQSSLISTPLLADEIPSLKKNSGVQGTSWVWSRNVSFCSLWLIKFGS